MFFPIFHRVNTIIRIFSGTSVRIKNFVKTFKNYQKIDKKYGSYYICKCKPTSHFDSILKKYKRKNKYLFKFFYLKKDPVYNVCNIIEQIPYVINYIKKIKFK